MKIINRRTFLRASGVALALPLLEAMRPVLSYAASTVPRRMLNICCTLGLYTQSWLPKSAGTDYETTEYLTLIDQHRKHYTLLSGLSHEEQTGRQAHNSEITWLTSARHPGLDGFQNTISIDQAAANHFGYVTRFPSVVLGTATPQSQSYNRNGVMVPAEVSPARLFKKMFLEGSPAEVEREAQRLSDGGSILDHLKSQRMVLRRQASAADQEKLEAYFDAVRTAEMELTEVQAWMDRPKPIVKEVPPVDITDNADLVGRIRLFFGLVPLIFETDSSRVVSLMIQDHQVVPLVQGVNADLHSLSHHGQDETKITQLKMVEAEIMRSFGRLLTGLGERVDMNGSL
ncbi:MAG: DUF1552 domain-containing protein, partial [Gammaproteobacteria bacterium]|nr:DUF1552 domain-containing protein [Gammaproteobacteria bacterium]